MCVSYYYMCVSYHYTYTHTHTHLELLKALIAVASAYELADARYQHVH